MKKCKYCYDSQPYIISNGEINISYESMIIKIDDKEIVVPIKRCFNCGAKLTKKLLPV